MKKYLLIVVVAVGALNNVFAMDNEKIDVKAFATETTEITQKIHDLKGWADAKLIKYAMMHNENPDDHKVRQEFEYFKELTQKIDKLSDESRCKQKFFLDIIRSRPLQRYLLPQNIGIDKKNDEIYIRLKGQGKIDPAKVAIAMDTWRRKQEERKTSKLQSQKTDEQSQKMDEQWEKDKDSVKSWKSECKIHDEFLANNKVELENYKKLKETKCSFSLRNLANRLFYNTWYWNDINSLEKEENELLQKRATKLYNFECQNYEKEKQLLKDHSNVIGNTSNPLLKQELEWFSKESNRKVLGRSSIKKADFDFLQKYRDDIAKE